MPSSFFYSKLKRFYHGYTLEPSGGVAYGVIQNHQLAHSMAVPVTWTTGSAVLHYFSYGKWAAYNRSASKLIQHPGFVIRGRALVVVGRDLWHYARVPGLVAHVSGSVSHLGFSAHEVVFAPAWRWPEHTYVFTQNKDAFFALRLAL